MVTEFSLGLLFPRLYHRMDRNRATHPNARQLSIARRNRRNQDVVY